MNRSLFLMVLAMLGMLLSSHLPSATGTAGLLPAGSAAAFAFPVSAQVFMLIMMMILLDPCFAQKEAARVGGALCVLAVLSRIVLVHTSCYYIAQ